MEFFHLIALVAYLSRISKSSNEADDLSLYGKIRAFGNHSPQEKSKFLLRMLIAVMFYYYYSVFLDFLNVEYSIAPNPIKMGDTVWVSGVATFNYSGEYKDLMENITLNQVKGAVLHTNITVTVTDDKGKSDVILPSCNISLPLCDSSGSGENGECKVIHEIFTSKRKRLEFQPIKFNTNDVADAVFGVLSRSIINMVKKQIRKTVTITVIFHVVLEKMILAFPYGAEVTIKASNSSNPFGSDISLPLNCSNTASVLPNNYYTTCLNNGTRNNFTCKCSENFFGPLCEYSCSDGTRTCNTELDTPYCQCPENFTGIHCLKPIGETMKQINIFMEENNTKLIVGIRLDPGTCNSELDNFRYIITVFDPSEEQVENGQVNFLRTPCMENTPINHTIQQLCKFSPYSPKNCTRINLKPYHRYSLILSYPPNVRDPFACHSNFKIMGTRDFTTQESYPTEPEIELNEIRDQQIAALLRMKKNDCRGKIIKIEIQFLKGNQSFFVFPKNIVADQQWDCNRTEKYRVSVNHKFPVGTYSARAKAWTSVGAGNFGPRSQAVKIGSEPPLALEIGLGITAVILLAAIAVSVYYRRKFKDVKSWDNLVKKIVAYRKNCSNPLRPAQEILETERADVDSESHIYAQIDSNLSPDYVSIGTDIGEREGQTKWSSPAYSSGGSSMKYVSDTPYESLSPNDEHSPVIPHRLNGFTQEESPSKEMNKRTPQKTDSDDIFFLGQPPHFQNNNFASHMWILNATSAPALRRNAPSRLPVRLSKSGSHLNRRSSDPGT